MELKDFIDKLFLHAKKEGFLEYEVYFVDRESLSINVYNEEVEKYNLNNSLGVSFRGKIGDKIGYSYTEILDDDAINMVVKKAKENIEIIENNDVQFIYEGDKEYTKIDNYSHKLENISPDKLIKIALNMEKEAKAYSNKLHNLHGCAVSYGSGSFGLVNSKGLNLESKYNSLSAYLSPVLKIDEEMQDGFSYVIAKSLDEVDIKKIVKESIDEALEKFNGKSIKSGTYDVIIKNEAMVSLLSSFEGVFSADSAQKGLSLLKDKEGDIIAFDKLCLVDNPHLKDGLASIGFDDEGVATQKTYVIKNGKLETLLHNLKTANKANVKSTGNGFKSSYKSTVGVSSSNFYIEEGNITFEDLQNKMKECVVITEFSGLHAGTNGISGEFSLAAKGYYYKDNKKDFQIEQITVAGNFFDLLKSIEEVCSDLKFPLSSIGSPSVKVSNISIAGK